MKEMKDLAINVDSLSKRYRIGLKETKAKTFVGQVFDTLKAPVRNFRRLSRMSRFSEEDESVFWALRDVNFQVKQGEVLGVIGHNGAGKSTLLKVLSRITEPTTGQVAINGRVSSLLEVGTGFHPELTGRENIYMNGTILGMRKREIDNKLEEIVSFSGIEKHIDTAVKFYSSGMKVRLGFSVAAHLEPEIMIIDEVLAVGDLEFQRKCLGKMEDVAGSGRTVLFVSHNIGAIRQLCTRCIVMNKGLISFDGDVDESIHAYIAQGSASTLGSFYSKKTIEKNALELVEGEVLGTDLRNKSQFNADEDIFVRLKCVKNESVTGVNGYFVIKNDAGDIFIESDTYDFLPNVLDQMELGEHQLILKIPKRLLPKGQFRVYINFASRYALPGVSLDSPKDILRFEIYDTTTARGLKRKALTNMIVEWKRNYADASR